MPVRRAILAAVLWTLGGCGGGSSPAAVDAASGGSAGSSGSAGSAGSGGGAGMGGGAGGAGGSSAPGGFDSIWRRASADLLITESTNPGLPRQGTITFPASVPLPGDGRAVEMYEQIKDDALITYAYVAGEGVYYRFSQPATHLEDTYLVPGKGGAHLFELKEGRLVDQSSQVLGTTLLVSTATYERYTGTFPPASWPTQMVEVK